MENRSILGPFGPFLHFRDNENFFKNPALSLFSTYQPLTSCKISKNSNEPILRKLALKKLDERTDGQMDGRTNGRTNRRTGMKS